MNSVCEIPQQTFPSFFEAQSPGKTMRDMETQTDVNLSIDRFQWEKHSKGVASRMMERMGYKGKGLGKSENGIENVITVESKDSFERPKNDKLNKERKLVYILSDSLLNQLDQTKLSRTHDVVMKCHGGCTIKCAYTHLPEMIQHNPDFILIHLGTNDCTKNTSCEIKNGLNELLTFIQRQRLELS